MSDLEGARSELNAVTGGARRQAELTAARQRARAAYQPFSAKITAARTILATASQRRDELTDRVGHSRFRAGRNARAQLAHAETDLAEAQVALDDGHALAAPANKERHNAEQTVAHLENTEHGLVLLDGYPPARQPVHPVARPMRVPAFPIRFSGGPTRWNQWPAPCLGEHDRTILGDLAGFSPEELDALERDGVIGAATEVNLGW